MGILLESNSGERDLINQRVCTGRVIKVFLCLVIETLFCSNAVFQFVCKCLLTFC